MNIAWGEGRGYDIGWRQSLTVGLARGNQMTPLGRGKARWEGGHVVTRGDFENVLRAKGEAMRPVY